MGKLSLIWPLVTLVAIGCAWADSFTLTSVGNVSWDDVYVNPYQAVDNTQKQNNPLTIYCDDWNTPFSGNPTWNANVYTLTATNLPYFKYGDTTVNYNVTLHGHGGHSDYLSVAQSGVPNAFTRYLEAAWLDEQWQNAVGAHTATATMEKQIAAAMWTLFVDTAHAGTPSRDPQDGLIGAINDSGYADAVSGYLGAAQSAVAGGYMAAGWDVIVPTDNSFPMQEFLVYGFTGKTAVPEPGPALLVGTLVGLLGLAQIRRSR